MSLPDRAVLPECFPLGVKAQGFVKPAKLFKCKITAPESFHTFQTHFRALIYSAPQFLPHSNALRFPAWFQTLASSFTYTSNIMGHMI